MKLNPETWVQEHGPIMYRYALARCSRSDVAENLVQEAFVAGLRSRDSFSGRSSERTWLMGILKHKLMDHYRKQARETSHEDLDAMPENAAQMFERNGHWKIMPSEWGSSPDRALQDSDFRKTLMDCLGRLPGRQAAVFTLREMDGEETEDIW